jgi:hypothetical protein
MLQKVSYFSSGVIELKFSGYENKAGIVGFVEDME